MATPPVLRDTVGEPETKTVLLKSTARRIVVPTPTVPVPLTTPAPLAATQLIVGADGAVDGSVAGSVPCAVVTVVVGGVVTVVVGVVGVVAWS